MGWAELSVRLAGCLVCRHRANTIQNGSSDRQKIVKFPNTLYERTSGTKYYKRGVNSPPYSVLLLWHSLS